MHTIWPTELEVQALGDAANLPNASSQGGFVAKAIAIFESRTGWNPWLPGDVSTQYLNAPQLWQQDIVYLDNPVISAEVYTHWSDSSQTGTLATENIDFVWVTENYPGQVRPKYGIKFLRSPGTRARCIKVVGQLGASCQIPDDLYQAILDGAFSMAIPLFRQSDGPVAEEKTDKVSIKYGIEAGRSKQETLMASFNDAINRYSVMKL
jgi:hypothetical protein